MLKIGDKVRSKKGLFELGEVVEVWEANTNQYAEVSYEVDRIEGIPVMEEVSGIQTKEFEKIESILKCPPFCDCKKHREEIIETRIMP